jgi:glycosyltransferase involved in cell wall biosynthesis
MQRNLKSTLEACRGKYIAVLDSDDYWTDPDKLQKQVEVLETEPNHAICCHKVRLTYEDSQEFGDFPERQKSVATIEDLLRSNFIAMSSSVVRRAFFQNFPRWIYRLRNDDWAFHILLSERGTVAYIDETMAVYRQHAGGQWSATPTSCRALENLKLLDSLKAHFGTRYAEIIDEQLFNAKLNCAVACAMDGNWQAARAYACACIASKPYRRNLYRKCAIAARVYAPLWVFRLAKLAQSRLQKKRVNTHVQLERTH